MTDQTAHSSAHAGAADLEPATPPRPLTRAARSRSWSESRVRAWLILALTMFVVTAGFAFEDTTNARAERWLIDHGQRLDATVIEINGTREKNSVFNRSDELSVWITFTPPGKDEQKLQGYLYQQDPAPGEASAKVRPGQTIPVYVDPDDPASWTDRTSPRAWTSQYIATLMLAPVAALLLAMAVLQRRRVLAQWRTGSSAVATVVSHKDTAVAPLSYRVAMALSQGDRRVFEVLIPKRLGVPQPGDEWWVITRTGPDAAPAGGRGALVAALYQPGRA